MNQLDLKNPASINQFLQQRRGELEARLQSLRQNLAAPLDPDLEDQAVELEDSDVTMAVIREAEQELVAIDQALLRVEQGRYGRCVDCGDEIAPARIQASPLSPYCIDCATLH